MAGILGTLKVYLEGDNRDLLKKLRASEASLKNTRSVLMKTGSSLQTVGGMMTKGITVPMAVAGSALGVITAKAVAFEKQMKEVFTLLPGITQEGMDAMTADLHAFSREMGIMPEQSVKPLYDALSAGVPKDNVFDFMRVAAKNSVGGVAELSASVDLLTSVVNAYKFEAEDAGKVSDILFTTVRLGKTTISELSGSISDVTPIASALGVTFEDIGAAIASMTAQGISTAETTTQLKGMLNELGKESSNVSVIFKSLTGETFPDFITQGHNLGEALGIIDRHARANNTSINNLFGNIRAGQAALALSGSNMEAFTDNLEEMNAAAGATDQAFGKMEESVSRRWDKIKTSLYNSVIETGEKMFPILEQLVPVIQAEILPAFVRFAEGLGDIITKFSELDPGMQKTIAVMAAITAGAGPALSGMGRLVSGVGNVSKAMGTLKVVASALFSPTGLLIAGVAAATAGIVILYKRAQEKMISAEFEAVAQALNEANLNSENLDTRIQEIADKTGLTVDQVLDLAEGHGLITDELREQAEVLRTVSEESEYSAKEIAKQNSFLRDSMAVAANGGADMAEVARNYSKNAEVSLDRTVALALQLENLNQTQKEQLESLKDSLETQRIMADQNIESLRNEKLLTREFERQTEEAEKVEASKAEQIAQEQELLEIEKRRKEISDAYKAGYAEILSIIEGESTETEKLQEKIEEISKFNWGEKSVYTEKQEQALAILQGRIDEINQEELDAIEEKKQAIRDANQDHYNDYRDLIDNNIEQLERMRSEEIRNAEENGENTYWIARRYEIQKQQMLDEMAEQERQRNLRTAQSWTNVMSSAFSSISAIFSQLDTNRSQELDNWYQNEKKRLEDTISNEEDLNTALEKLDEDYEKKQKEQQYEEAKRQKAFNIFAAGLNAAQAVLNALTVQPFFPLGLTMATLAGALGAAQVAAIAAQPLPELAEGARVKQTVGGSAVIIGEGNNDEAVLPLSAKTYQEIGKGISENMGSIENAGQSSSGSVMHCQLNLYLGNKTIAKETVRLLNNGVYTLNQKAVGE